MTAQLSLRFDRSYASMLESRQAAIPGFPTLLPAIIAPAQDKMIDLSLFSPRVGISYALDEIGPHAAARQLRHVRHRSSGPARCRRSRRRRRRMLIYSATDRNGNNVADPNELDTLLTFAGVDPANPAVGRQLQSRRSRTSRRRRRTSSWSASIAS